MSQQMTEDQKMYNLTTGYPNCVKANKRLTGGQYYLSRKISDD